MKRPIREVIRTSNVAALAEHVRDDFGVTLTEANARSILDEAAKVGGPAHDSWSESTWRMWLKRMATQPPQTTPRTDVSERVASGHVNELAAALIDSSHSILSTREFRFCEMANANDLFSDHAEEVWHQLFPATEAIGTLIKEQFDACGGATFVGRAPFASWLFARLSFLGIPGVEEENDLGGYTICFVVKLTDRPVGILLIDADSERVEIHLEAETTSIAERIKEQFTTLLLRDFRKVAKCELEVNAAEIGGTNFYGWTGEYFLGAGNVSG